MSLKPCRFSGEFLCQCLHVHGTEYVIPYIKQERRRRLDPHIAAIRTELEALGCNVGDVNYCITSIVAVGIPEDANYVDYNSAIGILECAKLEFFRTEVAAYEEGKRFTNRPVAWYRRHVRDRQRG